MAYTPPTDGVARQVSLGRANLTGNASNNRDLYLDLFSGEVFKGFQYNSIARDLVMKRTLKNGKSLQFIYTGRTKASYHTPGTPILGNDDKAPPVAEKTITVDDLLISSAFLYELDETLAHYELRGEISRKIGYALAETYDRKIFRSITRGARSRSKITASGFEEPGGTQIRIGTTNNASGTEGHVDALNEAALVKGFYDAAAALDEKGVSSDGRVAVINPRQYYALIRAVGTNGLVNRDVQGTALQSGQGIIEIAGIQIYKSMNVPFLGKFGTNSSMIHAGDFVGQTMPADTAVSGDTYGSRNNYGGQVFGNSCGLIFQKEAAGVVEAIGPQVQVTSNDTSVMYQGDLIVGRLAMGADFLNPAAAVEFVCGVDPSVETSSSEADYLETNTTGAAAF